MRTVAIIGMGRMGRAIDRGLRDHFDVRYRISRRPLTEEIYALGSIDSIDADIVIVATNDDSIAEVARSIADKIRETAIVLHTSGSLSSSALEPLNSTTRSVGSMHPLVSVSLDSEPSVFHRAYFCVEGEDRASQTAIDIVNSLGGVPFSIASDAKPLYHAAAVSAAGHVTALIDIAEEMMQTAGVPSDKSLDALLPLIESVIANIRREGTKRSLTGTYARGDVETTRKHIDAVKGISDRTIRNVFFDLAIRSIAISRINGIDKAKADTIEELLRIAKIDGGE
jgi:predicted short-subunit dehydrogenase-like oxidoreductase (DUF2520 family)